METETRQQHNIEEIALEVAELLRNLKQVNENIRTRHFEEFSNVDKAQGLLDMHKKRLNDVLRGDADAGTVKAIEERLDDLALQAKEAFDVNGPRTHKFEDGAGIQFRASVKTIIEDERALADHLLDDDLWVEAGASLKVDAKKMQKLASEGISFDGVKIDVVPTVALLRPKEE